MGYIIGLFMILALVFSYFGDYNLLGSIATQLKDKTIETIIPKTEKEIVIDNLNSESKVLGDFFTNSAPSLLKSKTISEKEKVTIQKAAEAFKNSQSLISNLQKLEKADTSITKSLTKSIIDKVLNLDLNKSDDSRSDPTNIPPQCRLECPGN